MHLLGVINRGSPKLSLNALARKLSWFCLQQRIIISDEWVPREANAFAYEISKCLTPDESSISRPFFNMLDFRRGPHTIDIFLLMRITIVTNSILLTGAEAHRVSMNSLMIGAWAIVELMHPLYLSEKMKKAKSARRKGYYDCPPLDFFYVVAFNCSKCYPPF